MEQRKAITKTSTIAGRSVVWNRTTDSGTARDYAGTASARPNTFVWFSSWHVRYASKGRQAGSWKPSTNIHDDDDVDDGGGALLRRHLLHLLQHPPRAVIVRCRFGGRGLIQQQTPPRTRSTRYTRTFHGRQRATISNHHHPVRFKLRIAVSFGLFYIFIISCCCACAL